MSQDGYHIIVEADDNRDDAMAGDVATALLEAYPGHPWHIRVAKGMLVIKHMKLSAKIGVARRYDRLTWDSNARKREVVMAAGELLERAGLTRGRVIEGEFAKVVEGVKDKHLLPESERVMN